MQVDKELVDRFMAENGIGEEFRRVAEAELCLMYRYDEITTNDRKTIDQEIAKSLIDCGEDRKVRFGAAIKFIAETRVGLHELKRDIDKLTELIADKPAKL